MKLHPLLLPYEPTAADPFDTVKAAHLLNRATFGGTPSEIDNVVKLGPSKAVDSLLDFPDQPAADQDPDDVPDFSMLDPYPAVGRELARKYFMKPKPQQAAEFMKFQAANKAALVSTGDWWLKRMV